MNNKDLKDFSRNTKTLVERATKLVNKKEQAEGKRSRLINRINGTLTKAIDAPAPQPYIDKARKQIDELMEYTEKGVMVPVKLFCSVIENHVHMGGMILRNTNKDGWYKEAYKNMTIYNDIAKKIREEILPVYDKQNKYLNLVKQRLSIVYFTKYEHEHRYERDFFRDMHREANIRVKKILRMKKQIRILSRKFAKTKEENKGAFLIFELSTGVLGAVCGFTATYQTLNIVLKAFSGSMNTMQSALGIMNMGSDIIEISNA